MKQKIKPRIKKMNKIKKRNRKKISIMMILN